MKLFIVSVRKGHGFGDLTVAAPRKEDLERIVIAARVTDDGNGPYEQWTRYIGEAAPGITEGILRTDH